MGLNASVFCNCYETGRMTRPPQPDFVYLDEMGEVSFDGTILRPTKARSMSGSESLPSRSSG